MPEPTMIDTHAHVYMEQFDADRDEMMARAAEAGVTLLMMPNVDGETIERMTATAERYPNTRMMMGLHPTEVKGDFEEVLGRMKQLLQAPHPYVAIGEIGLDFYWDTTFKAEQLLAFSEQLQWARESGLGVSIHCREAYDALYNIMVREKCYDMRGIFHCFAGTREDAVRFLTFEGFMFGVGGTVTYKKSTLPETLKTTIPLERIVLETDAPYLTPTPHRGKRNEPAYLVEVVKKLAEVYEVSEEEVKKATTFNAGKVF